MANRFLRVQDRFYPKAQELRKHFDDRFANPTDTRSDRFVWDYWYVQDQYCLHRTPAYHFFPPRLYAQFHKYLVAWGRANLGCYDISPPWLSYYIDGGEQQLHSDVPHGPWAYVFSLTNWNERQFEGGETLILKPQTLSYWSHFSDQQDHELNQFVERVPSTFNRLTVFDPRFPHGVTRVSGVRDPRQGRIVIHGWFTQPEVYVVGRLTRGQATKVLNEATARLQTEIPAHQSWRGTLILQLVINASGQVNSLKIRTNSLIIDHQSTLSKETQSQLSRILKLCFLKLVFPSRAAPTHITLPLIFSS